LKIENRKSWITVNGTPLQISGQTGLSISKGKTKIEYTFVIAKNLSHDILIGSNLLKKINVQLISNKINSNVAKINVASVKVQVKNVKAGNSILLEKLEEQITKLKNLIDMYLRFFNEDDEDLGIVDEKYGYFEIELENNKPMKQ
ncbi:unnamed protein product, partial [Brachionus calyciflorus]